MKSPTCLHDVNINFEIQGGESFAFYLNECNIQNISITTEELGCAGLFCDKQRILEFCRYNQGYCCYSFDSRRTNMVVDNTLNITHIYLHEHMHISNSSSVIFFTISNFCIQYTSSPHLTRFNLCIF